MKTGLRIGIFLPNWIGDVVMATPAIRAIRMHFGPDTRLTAVMKPYVGEVLEGLDWFDERWWFDPDGADVARRPLGVTWRILRSRFDWMVLLPNARRIAKMAWLGRAARRVGYARYERDRYLTHAVPVLRANGVPVPISAVDSFLAIARAMGCPDQSFHLELGTTASDEAQADRVWDDLGLGGETVVVLNSSASTGSVKLWPEESCAALSRRIVHETGARVLVLCGPNEEAGARRIATLCAEPRVVSLAGRPLSVGLSKACVRRSQLMVTTDSGPRHFAAAFGVPVITLYGPTNPAWSDLRYSKETKLSVPVDCGPCDQTTCHTGDNRCMRGIDVDRVFRAVQDRLREVRCATQVRA